MANSNYFADKSSNGYNQVKKPIDQLPDTSQSFNLLNQQDSQIPRLFDSSTVVPDIQSFQHQFNQPIPKFQYVSSYQLENAADDKNLIYCLDYAQNKIVAGLRSGIIIWCTVRKKCIRKLEVNSGSIYCVKITGDLIFSGGKNREIKIFNINTGDCLRSLVDKHINSVLSLSIHSGILVSCSSSDNNSSPKRQAQVLLWKIEDIFHTLNPFSDLVSLTIAQRLIQNVLYNCYVVDSDEEFFVANLSHNMIIFNIHTSTISAINGQEVNLDSKPVDITYLKLNSQHNLLISGFKNGTIKIWDLKNFTCLRTNRIHTGQIVCIRCDENYLLAASYDGLYVFNLIRLKDHNELDPIIQCFKQERKDLFTFYFDKSQIVLGLKNSIIACYEPNLGHENC